MEPSEKYVSRERCDLISSKILDSLEKIEDMLNPRFAQLEQNVKNHLNSHKEAWSKSQILIAIAMAMIAIGSVVVAIVK